jgi:hypothetical protein
MGQHRSHLRVLRDKVEVTYSNRLAVPTWHLTTRCKGLEHTPDDARAYMLFDDVDDLAQADGRSCRMCALEAVLRTMLSTRPRRGRYERAPARSIVTFASTPAMGVTHGERRPTLSGQARVQRLAKSLSLATTHLPGTGIIAYGQVAQRGIPLLLNHLHGYVLSAEDVLPAAPSIECFWSLAGDNRPGFGADEADHASELWSSALLLTC